MLSVSLKLVGWLVAAKKNPSRQNRFKLARATMASKKTVLITGCSQGIGLEFVKHYVAQGWNVIATARNLSKTPDLGNAKPTRMEVLDVVNEASIAGLVERLKQEPIDLLINNAGILSRGNFESSTRDDIMSQVETNAIAPFLLSKALLPNLEASNQSPLIVNITEFNVPL